MGLIADPLSAASIRRGQRGGLDGCQHEAGLETRVRFRNLSDRCVPSPKTCSRHLRNPFQSLAPSSFRAPLGRALVEDRRLQTGQAIGSWFKLAGRPDGEQLGRNDLDSHARNSLPDHAKLFRSAFAEINNAPP
jgi:hypothetical protein